MWHLWAFLLSNFASVMLCIVILELLLPISDYCHELRVISAVVGKTFVIDTRIQNWIEIMPNKDKITWRWVPMCDCMWLFVALLWDLSQGDASQGSWRGMKFCGVLGRYKATKYPLTICISGQWVQKICTAIIWPFRPYGVQQIRHPLQTVP